MVTCILASVAAPEPVTEYVMVLVPNTSQSSWPPHEIGRNPGRLSGYSGRVQSGYPGSTEYVSVKEQEQPPKVPEQATPTHPSLM